MQKLNFFFEYHSLPELLESMAEYASSYDESCKNKPLTYGGNVISKGISTSSNHHNYLPYDFDNIAENSSNINAEFRQSLCVIPYNPDGLKLQNKPISHLKQTNSTKKETLITFASGTIKKTPLLNASDTKPCDNRLSFQPIHKSGFGFYNFPENRHLLPPERKNDVTNQRNFESIGWEYISSEDQSKRINELLKNINSQ